MISIEIGNSYSRIKGLNPKQERELKTALSYTVGGSSAYFSGYGVRKKSLLSKGGEFPTGLLERVVAAMGYINNIKDNRFKPPSWPQELFFKYNDYPWQVASVKAAYKAPRGIITAPTGTGKSRAMAMLISNIAVNTLVIVPTLEIKKQLSQTLPIGTVVENIDSSALKNPNTYKGIECLIIDEAHHSASKTYRTLNKIMWKDIYYRYFYTATPFRNDTEETLLFESIAGRVIYKLDYKTAIRENYIVPVEAYYIDIHKQENDCYTYQEVYKKLVVENSLRNTTIARILLSLREKSTLCLVKEVRHGALLQMLTGEPMVAGEFDESREYIPMFNSGDIKVLIATTAIMGEGVDSKPCEYVVIAGLGKAKSQFMQQVGRAVRKYPGKESAKVIIFRDRSHKYLLRHFNEQKKILKEEYGATPLKLELK